MLFSVRTQNVNKKSAGQKASSQVIRQIVIGRQFNSQVGRQPFTNAHKNSPQNSSLLSTERHDC